MQKLTLTTILSFLLATITLAQKIKVKSFNPLPNDLTARVDKPVTDQNGEKCALIKIETTQTGFAFEGGSLGITKTVNKIGEIWVYVPRGSKKITIKHAQLGILRDYLYGQPITSATVYQMKLTTANVITTVEEVEIVTDWMVFTSQPEGAALYFEGADMGNCPQSLKKPSGKYQYRLEMPMYHNVAGTANFNADEGKKTYNFTMKPAFGWAQINTGPEQGATLVLDNKPITGKTPFKTGRLLSGKHKITARLPMYKPKSIEFEVNDNKTTELNINLEPNFAEVTITTNPTAKIYIDDVYKAEGSYSGRLNTGLHTFEAKKDKHKSHKQQKETFAGQPLNLQLKPTALLGNADIISTPINATIKLNGINKGTTPITLKKLLIGNYQLLLEKQGYGNINKTITITQGKTITINEKLPSGKKITINSTPTGAAITIDGIESGNTPLTTTLSFGQHTIKLKNKNRQFEKTINISQNGQATFNFDVGTIEMVFVKGGTFKMGSNESSNEKSIHSVTVDDFYIGKYELTQKQWKAVMGSNPSRFKGDNLPVESVSWYNVVEFCNKLSQKEGLTPYYDIDKTRKDRNNKIKNKYDKKKWTITLNRAANGYRLPTEAEWEYAARGGVETRLGVSNKYAGSNNIDEVAWYDKNSYDKGSSHKDYGTHVVGTKKPNELGLYDMSGNVYEWCWDWYGSSYYGSSPQNNLLGALSGSSRVPRGGSWSNGAKLCRVAYRNRWYPYDRSNGLGFRLVRVP